MKFRLIAVAVVAAVLWMRFAAVYTYHAPAGDGVQYANLANELRRSGRFAFSPFDKPTYARLPGYPLFTVAVTDRKPTPLTDHEAKVTRWNVLLDLFTALVVLALLRDRGYSRWVQLAGVVATLLHPALLIASSYAMTESLSTLLGTLELWLILRAGAPEPGVRRPLAYAGLAGAVAALAQLTRADAITVAPALGVVLLLSKQPWKQRFATVGVFLGVGLVVFSPWPIRNWRLFGAPHPLATTWRTMKGQPLPTGPLEWARTWSGSDLGESLWELRFANRGKLNKPGNLIPQMWDDDPVEKEKLMAIVERYNHELLTPEVDAEFRQLARERRRAHRWRWAVTLPARRVMHLWAPTPEWEFPYRVYWLKMPAYRWLLGGIERTWMLLALVGAVFAWKRHRTLLAAIATVLACRTMVFAWAIPEATTGRYLIEVVPLLIVLGVIGVHDAAFAARSFLLERRRNGKWRHQARQGPNRDAGAEARGPKGASLTSTAH